MIDLSGMISLPYLKKSAFSGSYQGMRYLLKKAERVVTEGTKDVESQTETVLRAVIWPEPYGYDATQEEKKHAKDFTFSGEGILQAVAWLNEEYEAGHF